MDQQKPIESVALSRRGIMQAGLLAGVGLATGITRADEIVKPSGGKAFRLAHLTDMHVIPGGTHSGEGYTQALKSLQQLDPKPDLLITGGDHVMDSMSHQRKSVDGMWDLYQKVLKDGTDLPAHPVIGNHDCFGWGANPDQISPDTVGYGKKLYCEKMGLEKTYYSFDAGGWHFICLDNIGHVEPSGYLATLGAKQEQWLVTDLEKTPKQTPICIITHIPIIAICMIVVTEFKGDSCSISDGVMHPDAYRLIKLLRKYNVKLCISGHIHMVDRIDYLGITFICDGAVSGNWWKGKHYEFDEGYGVFDFHPDGTFEHQYRTFGWVAAT